ncbi:bifunctional ADP-dependent NAD(P)H-hydrate dehydratase/NAD(P)H-hydrate epimerase [Corynebacterium simulans]|uniref:ADP-dependent (S)-NAD(P)H-hydrate dehydratase n=1 Tax=Corynebacterium accolens TaxID=38284 RepID=A0A2A4AKZ2_9CORY|nr:bifunctional ADP-dependent NAD(P)H-hydrate dehydratase/NAD(P)H-hydrate epimerase [Corynebacterium simulans]MCG7248344.1 bifunctional ADP-dependent NAD(P)H-hydrate dehydratase/NAD(P)H-hydrate epimerase [Corynebacterium simulans]PCC83573.1 carbohydrate kinase [Corynebacterium accolens]
MRYTFSVDAVRAAEERLLAQQNYPDQLTQLAAHAVADAAAVMLAAHPGRVMILAGSGGNGGDGLFASALLAQQGHAVTALVPETCHTAALAAFEEAGGEVLNSGSTPNSTASLPDDTSLLIDAVAGLGSGRGLSGQALEVYEQAAGIPVLAVDMPTGINADTGVAARKGAVHADVTVTFGWARMGHVLAAECGQVVLADLTLPGATSFSAMLESLAQPAGHIANEPTLESAYAWRPGNIETAHGIATHPRPVGCTGPIVDPTPGISSDKYSGGVVTIAAGSDTYPGAGILAATAAVRTSPAMVRCIADPAFAGHIIACLPEVVLHRDVESAGRTQCYVVGPGRGTDAAAQAELEALLRQPLPMVIDADAITLLATHEHLRELLRGHPLAVLTPHEGEFARLYEATFGKAPDPARGYAVAMEALSCELGCIVLLKGRNTLVTAPGQPIYAYNAGHSYAATPGSGDVLAGILGAVLAQMHLDEQLQEKADFDLQEALITEVLHAGAIHAHAAAIAAQTPEGYAICSASQIAAAIPRAIAKLLRMAR